MAALVGGKPQALALCQAQPPCRHISTWTSLRAPRKGPLPPAAQDATITMSRPDTIRCGAAEVNYGRA